MGASFEEGYASGVDAEAGQEVRPEGLGILFFNVGEAVGFPLLDLGVPVVGEIGKFFDAGLTVVVVGGAHRGLLVSQKGRSVDSKNTSSRFT